MKHNLRKLSTKDIKLFTLNNLTVLARIPADEVYDGDTCKAVFYYQKKPVKYTIRMTGYDSPEMKPRLNNPNRDQEKKAAIKAKEALIKLVASKPDQIVVLQCGKWDKYGRSLGTIYLNQHDQQINRSVNQIMIDRHFGIPYNGGKKKIS
uniref:Thermonuclease/nuclease n=1 Tax=Marseillevirus LCMAC201 TaxID=2506605 RepID=A0A481YXF0_9VIRU|nr:MAG: thermonuclease/nuclease [Marseillevirus LCMAC201]